MKKSLLVKMISGVVLAVVTIAGVVSVAAAPRASLPVAAGSDTSSVAGKQAGAADEIEVNETDEAGETDETAAAKVEDIVPGPSKFLLKADPIQQGPEYSPNSTLKFSARGFFFRRPFPYGLLTQAATSGTMSPPPITNVL